MSKLQPKEVTADRPKNRTSSMDDHDPTYIPSVGDHVLVGPTKVFGTVAFFGKTNFSDGQWIGVVLTEPVGKNDGSVKGHKYFDCPPNQGLFVRLHQVVKATTEALPVPKQDSPVSASSPLSAPRRSAQVSRVMEVQHKLANAVEEVDELVIRELLPQAYSLGVPHGVIENAQRTLNFRLHESLVRELDRVRDVVGGLAECAKELEAEFTKVAHLSTLLPTDAPKARLVAREPPSPSPKTYGYPYPGCDRVSMEPFKVETVDVPEAKLQEAKDAPREHEEKTYGYPYPGCDRVPLKATEETVYAPESKPSVPGNISETNSFVARLKAQIENHVIKGLERQIVTAVQQAVSMATRELVAATAEMQQARAYPEGSGKLKARQGLLAAHEKGELGTILQEVRQGDPESIKLKARRSLAAAYSSGELNTILQEVNSDAPGSIKLKARRSLAAAYSSGELNAILQEVNSDASGSIKLKARRSLAAAYNSGELNNVLQELNSEPGSLRNIKKKAKQSLLESYNNGELGSILQDVTQPEPQSIKLKARQSLVAAHRNGQLGPILQTVTTEKTQASGSKDQAVAATKIEAAYRGKRARCEMEERKKAAVTIQRRVRSQSSAGMHRRSVMNRAQARHSDWLAIFQELADVGPGSDADPVLGESEFHTALSKVHPQLTVAQISVLWQGHASLADRDKVDLEAFIMMAEAVEIGDAAAAEWADMAAETFAMLGVPDGGKAATKIQANFRGNTARKNMSSGTAINVGQHCCSGNGVPSQNSAIVFIKPHAVTSAVEELVRKQLAANGIKILRDGKITAETIDEKKLIDKHYGAIASRAVEQKPNELAPQDNAKKLFNNTFGQAWEKALGNGLLFNSVDAATKLGIKLTEVGEQWSKLMKDKDVIKLGGGFYVGRMDNIFVINGFYVPMRAKFTTPGTCIHYFEVEWESSVLPWKIFRSDVIGVTDPTKAKEGSIRNLILQGWENMELKSVPNTGDNGVHASASPFEGLAEKANWLGVMIEEDPVGKALMKLGLSKKWITSWFGDPSVEFEGYRQSIFDMLEDLDVGDCLEKAAKIITVWRRRQRASLEELEAV